MSAYVLVEIQVNDPETYERYKELSAPTLAAHGGRYLARGGRAEVLEGEGASRRTVLLEFPSYEQAQAWWSSPEYTAARAVRQQAAVARMVLVDGHPPG